MPRRRDRPRHSIPSAARWRAWRPWPLRGRAPRRPPEMSADQRTTQGDGVLMRVVRSCAVRLCPPIIKRWVAVRDSGARCSQGGDKPWHRARRRSNSPARSVRPSARGSTCPLAPPIAYALFAHCFTCSKDTARQPMFAGRSPSAASRRCASTSPASGERRATSPTRISPPTSPTSSPPPTFSAAAIAPRKSSSVTASAALRCSLRRATIPESVGVVDDRRAVRPGARARAHPEPGRDRAHGRGGGRARRPAVSHSRQLLDDLAGQRPGEAMRSSARRCS